MIPCMAKIRSLSFLRQLAASVVLACSAGLAASPALAASPFADNMAQRTQACTACHGEQGRAGPDGFYPRLAGKPADYLYNQLLNFRDGRRHYGLMTRLVDPLSDAYLYEIAQHFASLNVPYAAPSASAQRAAAPVMARGRHLALNGDPALRLPACVQCHGASLTGALPQIPGLLGLPVDYLMAQLGGWRTGQRRAHAPDCMADVVRRLSDSDAYAVVSWLAAQPVPADAHPAAQRPVAPPDTPDLKCGSAPSPGGGR